MGPGLRVPCSQLLILAADKVPIRAESSLMVIPTAFLDLVMRLPICSLISIVIQSQINLKTPLTTKRYVL